MPQALFFLGLVVVTRCGLGADAQVPRVAPDFTVASIVNAADNKSDMLAPNTIGTIYGANLAIGTTGITAGDVSGGVLPINLGPSNTKVLIGNEPAGLFYVSPGQINFLVPPNLLPGKVIVDVTVDGIYLPGKLTLLRAAPALFLLDATDAVASRPDGSVFTKNSPAKPGELVVLWATGLGATLAPTPDLYLQVPTSAAALVPGANLSILLDGVAVPSTAIAYAGVAPGYGGLYQINLILPMSTKANPEIRLRLDGVTSVPKVYLPVVLN